jgi:hypothetical protein
MSLEAVTRYPGSVIKLTTISQISVDITQKMSQIVVGYMSFQLSNVIICKSLNIYVKT